jgi:hypothetical protein
MKEDANTLCNMPEADVHQSGLWAGSKKRKKK